MVSEDTTVRKRLRCASEPSRDSMQYAARLRFPKALHHNISISLRGCACRLYTHGQIRRAYHS